MSGRQIAGAPGRNGLAEAARRQREWDERPPQWWDADAHMIRRVAAGVIACGEHVEFVESCGPCRMYATAARKRRLSDG